MFSGFAVDPTGTGAGMFEGPQDGSSLTAGLEPGTIRIMPPGYDIRLSDPAQIDAAQEHFVNQELRAMEV